MSSSGGFSGATGDGLLCTAQIEGVTCKVIGIHRYHASGFLVWDAESGEWWVCRHHDETGAYVFPGDHCWEECDLDTLNDQELRVWLENDSLQQHDENGQVFAADEHDCGEES